MILHKALEKNYYTILHQPGRGLFGNEVDHSRVHSHAPSIRSHRGRKVVWPDFHPMRVQEEPVCIHLFRQNPVLTSLHLKSPVRIAPPQAGEN